MTDQSIFDDWAKNYEADVTRPTQQQGFPFAGYDQVLSHITERVLKASPARVLDLGAGTGLLTKRFYDAGCEVTALDFSAPMLKIARQVMPAARFILADFSKGLPATLEGETFDFIVMTYALHHIPSPEQAAFIRHLCQYLNTDGEILIGDIVFQDQMALEACQSRYLEDWDEEFYLVLDVLSPALDDLHLSSILIPPYTGVLAIWKPK